MSAEHFQTGQTIFLEGETSHDAYFIVHGSVEICINTAHGLEVLAVLGSGEVFGEMGMIMDRPRSATATSLEPTLVERIGEGEFESCILQNPERLHIYLGTLFERIRHTDMLLQRAEVAAVSVNAPAAEPVTYRLRLRSADAASGSSHAPVDIVIGKLPYRIGRSYFDVSIPALERNDLSIADSPPYKCSRNHCEIAVENGVPVLRDRGSKHGTWVNGQHVAVESGVLSVALPEGDSQLVFGSAESPHRFVLSLERA